MQLADGIVGLRDRLVFIESKAVWVREDKIDGSPEGYAAFLKLKYGATLQGDRLQRKGIAQLANSIRQLACGYWIARDSSLLAHKRIVPVLLVHDSLVEAPLHPWFLAREFAMLLDHSIREWRGESVRVGTFIVDNLIVVTVDDLEALETSSTHFDLLELFEDYSKAHPDRLDSLHNYIVSNRKYGDALFMSDRVRQAFSKALQDLERNCAP